MSRVQQHILPCTLFLQALSMSSCVSQWILLLLLLLIQFMITAQEWLLSWNKYCSGFNHQREGICVMGLNYGCKDYNDVTKVTVSVNPVEPHHLLLYC